MYLKVKDLPDALQRALAAVGYAKQDVEIEVSETYVMRAGSSGRGRKAFVVAVDLATGARERRDGSWGGANMFNPQNAVDLDGEARRLPVNFAVIYGSEGDGVRVSHVLVNPVTIQPLLPETVELSKVEVVMLALYVGRTSAGRKNQITQWVSDAGRAAEDACAGEWADPAVRRARQDATVACAKMIDEATDALIGRGFLARNKAGAISVTTEGKNACTRRPGEGSPGGYGWWPGKAEGVE